MGVFTPRKLADQSPAPQGATAEFTRMSLLGDADHPQKGVLAPGGWALASSHQDKPPSRARALKGEGS